jgi:hypothetical protein
LFGCRK